jgi:uncharacterized protein DUF955
MTTALPKAYETTLRQSADWLTRNEPFPIDPCTICERLGVTINRSADVPGRRAHIMNINGRSSIFLGPRACSTSKELNDWERFLVAHELGHFILYKEQNAKPLGESEYWKHERLCDSFAQWLLIPAHKAHAAARNSAGSAIAQLDASCKLERDARVPWPVAASAISEVEQNAVFFRVADLDSSYLRVRFSTLPNKKGLHRKVERTSLAGRSLLCVQPQLPIQKLDCTVIRELLWSEAQSCAALRTGDLEIRLAVIGSSPAGLHITT